MAQTHTRGRGCREQVRLTWQAIVAAALTLYAVPPRAESMLADLKRRIDTVNLARKATQAEYAPRLSSNVRKWEETVQKNYAIEVACADLEREVKRLRQAVQEAGGDVAAPGNGHAGVESMD